MFRITITETQDAAYLADSDPAMPDHPDVKRYEQTVEVLDLRRVIDAINYKPRAYKARAKKAEQP